MKAVIIILSIIVTITITKIINKIFRKATIKIHKDKALHLRFLNRLLNGLIWFCCVILILKQFEVLEKYFISILASSSVLVAVIGFAAQQSLGNIIAGLFISIFDTFQIGDRIKLVNNNITGIVEDITLRHTIIRNFQNSLLVVPNSVISNDIIENINGYVCNFLDITIDYDNDIDKAKELIEKEVKNNLLYESPDGNDTIQINCRDIDKYGVALRVSIWTRNINDSFKTVSSIREAIIKQFNTNKIKITRLQYLSEIRN